MDSFGKVKRYLISKQKEVGAKIKSIDEEEILLNQAMPGTWEEGTFSWQADATATRMAVKRQLSNFLEKIQQTLLRLNQGTYGRCERCGRQIDQARLEIMPTANLCVKDLGAES